MEFTTKQKVALLLRELRIDGLMSRSAVAKECCVSEGQITSMESMSATRVPIENLFILLDYYGWYLSDFFKVIEDADVDWENKYKVFVGEFEFNRYKAKHM